MRQKRRLPGSAARTRRLTLHGTLLLAVVGPIVVALAGAGYWGISVLERWAQDRLENEVELVARSVRLPLAHAIERDRRGAVEQTLASVFRTNRVYSIHVYDAQGARIATMGIEDPSRDREHLSRIATDGDRRGEYGEVGGRRVYSYFVPITDSGGRISGLLQVTRRRSDIEAEVRTLRARAGATLLIVLSAVVGLVLYGHGGAIGRPLQGLSESMQRVRRGERRHRAALGGPVEVVAVGQTLNSMLDSIDSAEREIRARAEQQRELEERLRESEKLAAVGQLAAGVAHELGAPLSVVSGKAQRAGRSDLPGHVADSLFAIRAEVRRMEQIVRQLLDFGRQASPRRKWVRADRIACSAAAAVAEEMPGQESTIRIAESAPPPELRVDPLQAEQVLINLIRNGVQAAPGGVVQIDWFRENGQTGFVVDDDGPGISASARSRVFEPFFTTKEVGEGTGLGLAVVHGLVERHGGTIEIEDSPLGGARFRVGFPEDEERS